MVLDAAQNKAHDKHGYCVTNKEQTCTGNKVFLARISVEISNHTGVGDSDQQHKQADGNHVGVHGIAQSKGRLLGGNFSWVAQHQGQDQRHDISA